MTEQTTTQTVATTEAPKAMTAAERNAQWLKDNHAKEGLFVITNIFPTSEVSTKNGARTRFNFSAVPVEKGGKFDINNSVYMSVLVKPDNQKRMDLFSGLEKKRYSITYRDSESKQGDKTTVFHNVINLRRV